MTLAFGNRVDAGFEASLRADLARVEDAIREATRTADPFVADAGNYLVEAGGKRFRPLVTLLAAGFGDSSAPDVIQAAAVVELTHLATLYHDDVMDEAAVRRGAASANARWGNTVAILTGDFLFSRASDLLADLGAAAVRLQARTFERLVTGQIHETLGPPEDADPIAHHLQVLADKTGSLMATSFQFGAMFAGCDAPTTEALRLLGEELGVAFQLADDILDIASETTESGKTPGTDLREGVPTLAVLYALAGTDPDQARLRELVGAPITDDDEHAEALLLLRDSGALAQARETLAEYVAHTRRLLEELPDLPARDALGALVDGMVDRTG